jgi:hypothetical protein
MYANGDSIREGGIPGRDAYAFVVVWVIGAKEPRGPLLQVCRQGLPPALQSARSQRLSRVGERLLCQPVRRAREIPGADCVSARLRL